MNQNRNFRKSFSVLRHYPTKNKFQGLASGGVCTNATRRQTTSSNIKSQGSEKPLSDNENYIIITNELSNLQCLISQLAKAEKLSEASQYLKKIQESFQKLLTHQNSEEDESQCLECDCDGEFAHEYDTQSDDCDEDHCFEDEENSSDEKADSGIEKVHREEEDAENKKVTGRPKKNDDTILTAPAPHRYDYRNKNISKPFGKVCSEHRQQIHLDAMPKIIKPHKYRYRSRSRNITRSKSAENALKKCWNEMKETTNNVKANRFANQKSTERPNINLCEILDKSQTPNTGYYNHFLTRDYTVKPKRFGKPKSTERPNINLCEILDKSQTPKTGYYNHVLTREEAAENNTKYTKAIINERPDVNIEQRIAECETKNDNYYNSYLQCEEKEATNVMNFDDCLNSLKSLVEKTKYQSETADDSASKQSQFDSSDILFVLSNFCKSALANFHQDDACSSSSNDTQTSQNEECVCVDNYKMQNKRRKKPEKSQMTKDSPACFCDSSSNASFSSSNSSCSCQSATSTDDDDDNSEDSSVSCSNSSCCCDSDSASSSDDSDDDESEECSSVCSCDTDSTSIKSSENSSDSDCKCSCSSNSDSDIQPERE